MKMRAELTVAFAAASFWAGCSPQDRHAGPPRNASVYPVAIDLGKVGTYPALAKAGGGYFYDQVLEYRVWVHPRGGGDDDYRAFATCEEALAFSRKTDGAEPPLALVRQIEWVDEPEPNKFVPKKGRRFTEWQVAWLKDHHRDADSIERFLRSKAAEQRGASQSRPVAR